MCNLCKIVSSLYILTWICMVICVVYTTYTFFILNSAGVADMIFVIFMTVVASLGLKDVFDCWKNNGVGKICKKK